MTELREEKIGGIARDIPVAEPLGEGSGDLLLVGWGGTYGVLHEAALAAQADGLSVSHVHLRHLNPLPSNLGDLLGAFKKVLVAELNRGQLDMLLRSRFLVDTRGFTKVQGQPFTVSEVLERIRLVLEGKG
jgi:2-oxoglutarate ferredoxin oxidoreductase subunit alpha